MKGTLERIWISSESTMGIFTIAENDKVLFGCYSLEDTLRGDGEAAMVEQWKVKGKSAIPFGTYKVRKTWSKKFGRDAWELLNVAGFAGIRIHAGNTAADTEGCLLFGEFISPNYTGVQNSKKAVADFETLMNSIGNPAWELTITREGV